MSISLRDGRGVKTSPITSRHGFVPALVGAIALGILGVVTVVIGSAQLETARENRLDDRVGLVSRFSMAGDRLYDPQALVRQANALPFSRDDPVGAEGLLSYFLLSPTSDPYVEVALVLNDQTVLASRPAGVDASRYDLGDSVNEAIQLGSGLSPVFDLDGQSVWARTIPLGGSRPWGVLVLVEGLEQRWLQHLYQDLGSLGRGDGGISLVDQRGVAAASWDPDKIGTALLTPEERANIDDRVSVWPTEVNGQTTVNIGVERLGANRSSALLFQQSEAALYGDLVDAQTRRSRFTYASLVASMFVLVAFTAFRQRAIQREERRAAVILGATDDIIALLDHDDRITSISSGLERMLGHRPSEWVGRPFNDLVAPANRDSFVALVARGRAEVVSRELGVGFTHVDGTIHWFDLTITDRRDHRHVGGLIVTCSPVGERKALEDELVHRSTHDALTGLANRAGFEAELTKVAAQDGITIVGIVDLDRFKVLNDTLGHEEGDKALQRVAAVIASTVGNRGTAARLGGDEFGFVLAHRDPSLGRATCQAIIDQIEAIWPGTDDHPGVSASIGVIEVQGRVSRPEVIMREADAAMYLVKKEGGAQYLIKQIANDDVANAAAHQKPVPKATDPAPSASPEEYPSLVDIQRPGPTGRQRLTRALPALVTAAVVISGIVATSALSARAGTRSEEARIGERREVIQALGNLTARTTSAERLMGVAAMTPWDLDDPGAIRAVLNQWSSSPALGTNTVASLVDRSGQMIVSSPPNRTPPPQATVGHPGWSQVLAGTPAIPPLATGSDGLLRFYWNLPIVRSGTVNEVLIVSVSIEDVSWSEVLELLGSLGNRPGGAVVVDSNGRVASSWNPSQLGEIAIDPALLGPASEARSLIEGPGELVTLVEQIPDPYSERYVLWQKRPDDFFGDLHQGQRATDASMVGAVVATLIGVGWINRRRERQLRRHEGRLDALMSHSSTVVLVVDEEATIDFASSALARYTGQPAAESRRQPLAATIGPSAGPLMSACADRERTEFERIELVDHAGNPRVSDVVVQPMFDRPEINGCLVTLTDCTERQRLEQRLAAAASHDPLTGLVNRAAFAAELERLQSDRRAADSAYAVIFIDLDHFKPINDEHGHHVGDEVLVVISRRLEAGVRAQDLVARHGGDEFTVLLRDCDQAHAEATTERLLAAIRAPIELGDLVVQVGASAGIVLGRPGSQQVGSVRDADHAMYEAKQGGRGRWVLAEI